MRTQDWAALFDWDGVIIDSSRQHERSWDRLAREQQCALRPDFFKRSFGMKNERIIPELLGWANDPARVRWLSRRKEEIYRELIVRDHIVPLPGVREWLNTLRAADIPCAIGSSTPRENIECVIDALKLRDFFPRDRRRGGCHARQAPPGSLPARRAATWSPADPLRGVRGRARGD